MSYADFENEVKRHFPREAELQHLEPHDLLAAWFVHAQLTNEDVVATRASLTKPPDAGVDAIHIDRDDEAVHLVQSKLRTRASHAEGRKDIDYLTKWSELLRGEKDAFDKALAHRKASATTKRLLEQARDAVDRGYSLSFHFVSTGRAPEDVVHDVSLLMDFSAESGGTAFSFVDREALLLLYEDYLAGVRPIPELQLPVAARYLTDEEMSGIEMSIFLVPGEAIGSAVDEFGPRLFARNVRGFQGENAVNSEILDTIRDRDRASRFRYMNNGITVLCDRMRTFEEAGVRSVVLWNPQVVNGQQTSYMLHSAGTAAAGVNVLMKVVRVRRDEARSEFETIVHDVVQASNWQTKVYLADLRSNDIEQVELGRRFRRLGHYYQRKTTSWGETLASARGLPAVTRAKLADAVGGCLYDSKPLREVKDNLYVDPVYTEIFNPREAERNLCCHYLWKSVRRHLEARNVPRERNRSKWLVLYHVYSEISPAIVKHSSVFIEDGLSRDGIPSVRTPLDRLIKATADTAVAFFRNRAGSNGFDEDAHNFFRTENLHDEFVRFLRQKSSARARGRIRSAAKALAAGLVQADEKAR
jgi:hypothetical protein